MKHPLFIVSAIAVAGLAVGGCVKKGDFDETGGIVAVRSACPIVAVPANTGDITLFNPPSSRDSRAIDVVADITNVRSACGDAGTDVTASVTFDVQARRSSAAGARDLTLPVFTVVMRGGNTVVAKRIGNVTLHFADGAYRATAQGRGGAYIDRASATLPADLQQRLRRPRRAEDADAAIDPLSAPDVRNAVAAATFEVLVGFQLTEDQLKYNATR